MPQLDDYGYSTPVGTDVKQRSKRRLIQVATSYERSQDVLVPAGTRAITNLLFRKNKYGWYEYSELDLEFRINMRKDVETMIAIIKGPNPFKIVRHSSGKMQYEIYDDSEIKSTNIIDPDR